MVENQTIKTIVIKNEKTKNKYLNEVYYILSETYKKVEGGLNFDDEMDLLQNTSVWKLLMIGNNVIGAIIFKSKNGLKLVALGLKEEYKELAKSKLAKLINKNLKKCWMEVSEAFEKFIMKIKGAKKYLIPNKEIKELIGKDIVEQCSDGIHYKRVINGVLKTKMVCGTPIIVNQSK